MARGNGEHLVLPAVVDTNVLVGVVSPTSAKERSASEALLSEALEIDHQLIAPRIQSYEIANTLTGFCRMGLFDENEVRNAVDLLARVPIGIAPIEETEELVALAVEREISAYDAAFLLAAYRHNATLYTLDRKLQDAARASGCHVKP